MRLLSVDDIVYIHTRVVAASGGSHGLRDRGALESSVALPLQAFAGVDLYPDLPAKAAALAFFLVSNHPFVDGNKRIAHAALDVTLRLNEYRLVASVDEQEEIMLLAASGKLTRESFTDWATAHVARAD